MRNWRHMAGRPDGEINTGKVESRSERVGAQPGPPPAAGDEPPPRGWRAALAALVIFVVVAVVVVIVIPGGGGAASQRTRLAIPAAPPLAVPSDAPSAVALSVDLESINPGAGSVGLRLVAVPGDRIPAQGTTIFTTVGAVPSLVVRPEQLSQERSAVLSFTSGDPADYPFDVYRAEIELVPVSGTSTSIARLKRRQPVTLAVDGNAAAPNMVVTARSQVSEGRLLTINLKVRRTTAARAWVLAMMAIYWALALLAASAVYIVVRRRRQWQTLLLTWMSAMLFALVAFRAAAPGVPEVGTFMDFFAVFEAVGIVALSLATLIIYYLVQPRHHLE